MGKLIDLTGQVFGEVTVIRKDDKVYSDGSHWVCKCSCGTEFSPSSRNLRSKPIASLGCMSKGKRLPKGEAGLNSLYRRYSTRASQRGYEFNISKELFTELTSGDCNYCGESPSQQSKARYSDYTYNGVDRVDNNIGYVEGNVVSCCKTCNIAKFTMSHEEYLDHCRRVIEYARDN